MGARPLLPKGARGQRVRLALSSLPAQEGADARVLCRGGHVVPKGDLCPVDRRGLSRSSLPALRGGGAGAGSAFRPPVLRRAPACELGPGSGVSGELGVCVAVRVLWPFRRNLRHVAWASRPVCFVLLFATFSSALLKG